MPCSAHASAIPFSSGSRDQRLNSTSTALISAMPAASRIVAAETSESEMPPNTPLSTYSRRTPKVSASGVSGSRLAHSNRSTFFAPPSCARILSIDRRTMAADPSGRGLPDDRSTPPLMHTTTLSASAGCSAK